MVIISDYYHFKVTIYNIIFELYIFIIYSFYDYDDQTKEYNTFLFVCNSDIH